MNANTDQKPTVLPLRKAYPFGIAHGLVQEVRAVQPDRMPIRGWSKTYTSSVRRGYIIELFQQHGIFGEFKELHWAFGNTSSGMAMTARFLRIKQDYQQEHHH